MIRKVIKDLPLVIWRNTKTGECRVDTPTRYGRYRADLVYRDEGSEAHQPNSENRHGWPRPIGPFVNGRFVDQDRIGKLVCSTLQDFVRFARMAKLTDLEIWTRIFEEEKLDYCDATEVMSKRGKPFIEVLDLALHNPDMFKAEAARFAAAFARSRNDL